MVPPHEIAEAQVDTRATVASGRRL